MIAWFARREGIACVQYQIVPIQGEFSMELIGPRLREDFDSSIAELVVLSRERILIDANLANRVFRGYLILHRETVNIELAAARTGRGTGQGSELGFQFVGVV